MPKLPVISGAELARTLAKLGYIVERTKGSHMSLRCPGRPPLTVPLHHELDRGTLRGILRDAGLSPDELIELLK